MMQPDHSV
jgi:hypothetical protein